MCGIAGFLHRDAPEPGASLARMLRAIAHRGPDAEGAWLDAERGLAMGHRRLSILELSNAGSQPMTSASGRYVLAFNGEIYNHAEIRARLDHEGYSPPHGWRGHSDTETLLEAMAAWGVAEALQTSVGMFALALWDRESASLTLARDRMGEKPLYFGWQGSAFLFGSELKALRAHDAFAAGVDWDAANDVLRLACIPAPRTIYEGIRKLAAGHMLTLDATHASRRSTPDSAAYWSLVQAADAADRNPFGGSYPEAVDTLEALLRRSVRLQSSADVPVGAFLSGGIDSSTVVALMQQVAGSRVTTFSIGMEDAAMDESPHAAAVARHLGTDHVAHVIQPAEALAIIPRLPTLWDEPFADASQVPTYLVSEIARQRVKVALSGDGGDELFLGYPQYPLLQDVWRSRALRHLPWSMGLAGASAFANRGSERTRQRVRLASAVVGGWRQSDVLALNRYWMDRFRDDMGALRRSTTSGKPVAYHRRTSAETAALADAAVYLPDDILVKVDRASMANSLEARAPLLDHRIVEFALSLPLQYKLAGGTGKRVLRDVLYRHVPRALVDRPKKGFSIPLHRWLRVEMRDWVEALLARISPESPVLDVGVVRALWDEHRRDERDRTDQLWPVLSLVAWCSHEGIGL